MLLLRNGIRGRRGEKRMLRVFPDQRVSKASLSQVRIRDAPGTRMDQAFESMEEEKVKLSERAEEILESLWVAIAEERKGSLTLGLAEREDAVSELLEKGYIDVSAGEVRLKEKGKEEAEKVIRRHRLAERLLVDVLDVKQGLSHEMGCKFEHLLREGIDENVCTLLGHPRMCPHGKPIPPGRCCEKSSKEVVPLVRPLKDMEAEDRGTIAYLATNDERRLHKLMAMGALPGLRISMIQKFPSYVFQIGQSQFAIDKEMAEGIYVRLERD
jgi:DtxR family Mn-dependent transcriptional regulator